MRPPIIIWAIITQPYQEYRRIMKKYRLTKDENTVQNTETTAFIPNDERNNDWQEYQNWLKGIDAEGEKLGNGKKNKPDKIINIKEI